MPDNSVFLKMKHRDYFLHTRQRLDMLSVNTNSDINIAVILKDYDNLMDIQLELMRLRRKIDSRIEPHPFRENEFEMTNPIVNEIIKYGQEINMT